MIILEDSQCIASGGMRECYLHPGDNGLIIKIEKPTIRPRKKPNEWEWHYYKNVISLHGELSEIPRVEGFVTTNLGRGLIVAAIRDDGGSISRTISQALRIEGMYGYDEVMEAVSCLLKRLVMLDIRHFDLNLNNIVLQRSAEGSLRAVLVDLKGPYSNCELFRISSWFRYLARKKVIRRGNELLKRIELIFAGKLRWSPSVKKWVPGG